MTLETQARIHVPRPPAEVYAFAVRCDALARVLRPFGPIPGVARAEMAPGPPGPDGALRHVVLTDGSALDELVTFDPPRAHRYRWRQPPPGPLALLVRDAAAEWTFAEAHGGTDVAWTYRFALRSLLAWPLAVAVLALFRRWMQRGLSETRRAIDGGGPGADLPPEAM